MMLKLLFFCFLFFERTIAAGRQQGGILKQMPDFCEDVKQNTIVFQSWIGEFATTLLDNDLQHHGGNTWITHCIWWAELSGTPCGDSKNRAPNGMDWPGYIETKIFEKKQSLIAARKKIVSDALSEPLNKITAETAGLRQSLEKQREKLDQIEAFNKKQAEDVRNSLTQINGSLYEIKVDQQKIIDDLKFVNQTLGIMDENNRIRFEEFYNKSNQDFKNVTEFMRVMEGNIIETYKKEMSDLKKMAEKEFADIKNMSATIINLVEQTLKIVSDSNRRIIRLEYDNGQSFLTQHTENLKMLHTHHQNLFTPKARKIAEQYQIFRKYFKDACAKYPPSEYFTYVHGSIYQNIDERVVMSLQLIVDLENNKRLFSSWRDTIIAYKQISLVMDQHCRVVLQHPGFNETDYDENFIMHNVIYSQTLAKNFPEPILEKSKTVEDLRYGQKWLKYSSSITHEIDGHVSESDVINLMKNSANMMDMEYDVRHTVVGQRSQRIFKTGSDIQIPTLFDMSLITLKNEQQIGQDEIKESVAMCCDEETKVCEADNCLECSRHPSDSSWECQMCAINQMSFCPGVVLHYQPKANVLTRWWPSYKNLTAWSDDCIDIIYFNLGKEHPMYGFCFNGLNNYALVESQFKQHLVQKMKKIPVAPEQWNGRIILSSPYRCWWQDCQVDRVPYIYEQAIMKNLGLEIAEESLEDNITCFKACSLYPKCYAATYIANKNRCILYGEPMTGKPSFGVSDKTRISAIMENTP